MASGLASFNARRNVRAPVMMVSTIQGSTITTASITTASITTGTLSLSTLTGSTISAPSISVSTLTGSTMTSNRLTLSTLTVSSINNGAPGVAAYSTFNASSINTSSITISSITTAPGYNSNIGNVLYTVSSITTGAMQVGIGTAAPISQLSVHGGNTSTAITVSNGFSADFYTQYGLAFSTSQYSANSLAGDTVIKAMGGNLVVESQNKNIYLSMPSTNTSNVLSIVGSGIRPTFSTAGWGSLTNTQQYNNIALSWTAPVTCNISSISMYLGQGNNGTNIAVYVNGTFINEWWPFQGYGLYVINATGSSVANGVATTPTPFSALNQLVVQAGQVLTIYISSLQTYNYFYYGRDSTTSGIGFSIVYNAPNVDLSLLNTTTTLSMGLAGVGIGTTAPGAILHVHDSLTTATSIPLMLFSPNLSAGGFQYLYFGRSNSANNSAQFGWANVGAGSASNYAFLQIYGKANIMTWQASTGNVGIGKTNPGYLLDVAGGIQSSGTSKLVIQNSIDGGSTAGIFYWNGGDTNWASYMATSGASRSIANATACTGAFGFTEHAIRMRVSNTNFQGFIWENSSETCLMSIRADGAGGGVMGRWGVNMLSPTNWLDTFDGTARTGTHATGRALYATFNGAEYSNGIAEFRHTNGTEGVGIGHAGLYACGSNTNQEFHIIAKGTGLINLRSPMRLTGPGDNCMTYYGPNSWNSYLVVGAGTDKAGASTAQVISTNGNLHLDGGNGNVIYYGYYSATRASSNSHQFYGNIYIANYVSIGTTTVRYPLYIPNGASWSWTLAYYLVAGGLPYHNGYGTWPVAIWSDAAIVTTMWFGTVSDQRIKKNIQPVGDMLEIINMIEIVSFDFIDEPNNKRDECGVIAQQLETVFPNAVDKSIGVIPCYLKFATSQHNVGDDVHILFDYDSTDPQQNFKVGDKIKIHAGQKTDTEDKDKGSHHVVVKSIIDGGFITEKWKDYDAEDGVFLHGKEVDDFRNVDKEQLGVLALKGVQELSSMVSALNGTCAALQQENIQLKSQLTNILSRLEALEAR